MIKIPLLFCFELLKWGGIMFFLLLRVFKVFHMCMLSHVWFFVTPWTVAHQASLPMELSRQEYWSGSSQPGDWTHLLHRQVDSLPLNRLGSPQRFSFDFKWHDDPYYMPCVGLLFLGWVGISVVHNAEELITFSQVGHNAQVLYPLYDFSMSFWGHGGQRPKIFRGGI